MASAKADLRAAADYVLENASSSAKFEGAVAYNFLMQMGYVLGAWYHLRSALLANQKIVSGEGDTRFYRNKVLAARFYIRQVMPRASSYGDAVVAGAAIGCELSADAFG